MATVPLSADLSALRTSLSNLSALLTTFQTALQSPITPHKSIAQSPNPLALLSDASKLLKAQTTKLSLLILNKPFSAKEVIHILSTLSKSILPALMSGLEICLPERYSRVLHEHVKTSLGVLWREMLNLVDCVPRDETTFECLRSKDTLASTGVLWEQCDVLVQVGEKGLQSFAGEKIKGYGELLEDAIAELDEWDPDEDEDEDSDDTDRDGDSQGELVNTPTTSEDEMLETGMQKLKFSPQAALRGKVLKHLRLIKMLYPALRKRRIATFPSITKVTTTVDLPSLKQVERLDALVACTKRLTDDTDELACAMYANDETEVKDGLERLMNGARACAEVTREDWNGGKDEFSIWIAKWKTRLDEVDGKG